MYENTQDFIQALERAGELRRLTQAVSPVLEITEIADRVSKSPAPHGPSASARQVDPRFAGGGGHALLFENVQGSDIPVLINAWGSYRRVEMALGCNEAGPGVSAGHSPGGFETLAHKIEKLVKPEPPPTLLAKLQKIPELLEIAKIPPRKVRSGICQEVVITGDKLDLTRLPIIKCWPHDGDFAALGYPARVNDAAIAAHGLGQGAEWNANFRGRYITLGTIHTIHADDIGKDAPPSRNVGMYRAQLFGRRHLAMHWHMHHDGARHWRSWKARGERMPVAIALGGESVMPYAATAPMPPGISELLLAGFLNRGPIPLVECKTVPLSVPANAEIVIEGWVSSEAGGIGFDPKVNPSSVLGPGAIFEGPFGDHTGFYSLPDRYPLLEVTALTHRRNPVYPTTIVGLPPQEDYYLGKATERIFLPLLRTIVPDILDYDLPMFGAFHNCAFIKIRKEYPLHARRVMHAIWGAGQMSWTKTIVVVDHDVDVHDGSAVLKAIGEHCIPARDSELVRGPVDILDHAAPFLGAGGKLGLDATRKTNPAETFRVLDDRAKQLCEAGPIDAVTGDGARATESCVRSGPGVLDVAVPEEFGGWWMIIRIAKKQAGDGARIIKHIGGLTEQCKLPRWTLVVGEDGDLADLDNPLFLWMANYSPDRDRTISLCGRRVAFDATPKLPGDEAFGQPVREWPPLISMTPDVRERIEARRHEIGV